MNLKLHCTIERYMLNSITKFKPSRSKLCLIIIEINCRALVGSLILQTAAKSDRMPTLELHGVLGTYARIIIWKESVLLVLA